MGKRIIVLSDGTGNSAAQVWRTNVWRTFEALDLTGSDQVAFYDDGVGTSSFKPLAILGGAFGFGLKRNVVDIYKFICRNYCFAEDYLNAAGPGANPANFTDDDIYGFGFSRGAFTIRVVVGLLLDQGIIKATSEAELDALATEAYRNYRARHFESVTGFEKIFRFIRDRKRTYGTVKGSKPLNHIRFLGLWDTVAAYGLPVDEMTRGVSRYIWPLELPNRRFIHEKVNRACHALSIDDQRTTFHPVLWDESTLPDSSLATTTKEEKLTQVWFAGVHANVGGGYPDDALAYIPMYWIWKEAQDSGLTFKKSPQTDPDALLNAAAKQDKDGRLYDSRSGFGGYYRYGPRDIEDLCNFSSLDPRDFVKVARPKIHESVFRRIRVGAYAYAPVGLPILYDIVSYNPASGAHDIHRSGAALSELPTSVENRYRDQLTTVWSTIWRGRGIYFLTVLASLYLVIYPLALTIPRDGEFITRLRALSDVIGLLSIPLPNAANRWILPFRSDPGRFLVAAGAILVLMYLSAGLRARITDQMRALLHVSCGLPGPAASHDQGVWRPQGVLEVVSIALIVLGAVIGLGAKHISSDNLPLIVRDFLAEFPSFLGAIALIALVVIFAPPTWVSRLRADPNYQRFVVALRFRYAPLFFAVSFSLLTIVYATHYSLNAVDSFGGLCRPTIPERLKKTDPTPASRAAIQPICSQNADVCRVNDVAVEGGADNCSWVDRDSICFGRAVLVNTSDLCTSTGVYAEKNAKYEIIARIYKPTAGAQTRYTPEELNWRFGGVPSTLNGTSISALSRADEDTCAAFANWETLPVGEHLHKSCNYVAGLIRAAIGIGLYPLKRTFDPSMGTLMLRTGSTGNEENYIFAGGPGAILLREQFVATRDGELFVYLNKPAAGFGTNWLRNYNSGIAQIKIVRVPRR
jgi:uncharacterized protein (DUF2235 family)